jgi:hypothetical protein
MSIALSAAGYGPPNTGQVIRWQCGVDEISSSRSPKIIGFLEVARDGKYVENYQLALDRSDVRRWVRMTKNNKKWTHSACLDKDLILCRGCSLKTDFSVTI